MLHPAEFISLLRSDLLLPGDTLNETAAFYVHIRNPKTARFARKQHCKIDDPCVLAYVTKVFGALAPNASLFAGGTSAYRRRWDHVLGRLGISVSMPSRGATPAVLRGSGATALYLESEDLIAWFNGGADGPNWRQLSITSTEDRAVVKLFADAAGPLLHSFLVDKSKQWRDGGRQFFQTLHILVRVAAATTGTWSIATSFSIVTADVSALGTTCHKLCSSCVMCWSLVRWKHSCGLQLSSFGPITLLALGGCQFFQALHILVWVAAALDDWYLECRNLFFYCHRWCISAWDNLPQAGKDCSSCVIYKYIYMCIIYLQYKHV